MGNRHSFSDYNNNKEVILESDAYIYMAAAQSGDPEKVKDLASFAVGSGEIHALTYSLKINPDVIKNDSFKNVTLRVIKEKDGSADAEYLKAMVEYASTRDSFIAENGKDLFEIVNDIKDAEKSVESNKKLIPEMLGWAKPGTTLDLLEKKKMFDEEIKEKTLEANELRASIADNNVINMLRNASQMFMKQADEEKNKAQACIYDAQALEISNSIGEVDEKYEKGVRKNIRVQDFLYGDVSIDYYSAILRDDKKDIEDLAGRIVSSDGKAATVNGNIDAKSFDF